MPVAEEFDERFNDYGGRRLTLEKSMDVGLGTVALIALVRDTDGTSSHAA